MPDTENWVSATETWVPDTENWVSTTETWVSGTKEWVSGTCAATSCWEKFSCSSEVDVGGLLSLTVSGIKDLQIGGQAGLVVSSSVSGGSQTS